jgi:hypothetical protein
MEKTLPSTLLDSVPGEVKVRGKQNKVERIKPNKGEHLERNKERLTEGGRGRLGTNKKQQVERQKKNLAACSNFPNQINSVCRHFPAGKQFLPLLFNLKTQLSQ